METTQSTPQTADLWESDAESKMLESRLYGFWNLDYFTQILIPQLKLKPGAKVLDVGAGNGSLTLLLARHQPDVHFVGLDLTPKIISDARDLAQKLRISNVEFVEGDAYQLPFEDASFDAVVCQTLLIHLSNPAAAVKEMSRVMKQGGIFMAAEYHTLFAETPIDAERIMHSDEEGMQLARCTQMIINGYRKSGHGDLKAGGRVPFMALEAGLQIRDIRINDRVPHAFPPYHKPTDQAALTEGGNWLHVLKDPAYRAWMSGCILAGGGAESDVDAFLNLLITPRQKEMLSQGVDANYAFLWMINPVLLVTLAQKP